MCTVETIIKNLENLRYLPITKTAQNIMRHIVDALNGKKIRLYISGENFIVKKVPQSASAYCVCLWSDLKVTKGNDFKGCKVGDYWAVETNHILAKELEKYIIK